MRLVRGEICRKIFYLSLAFSWHVSKKEEEEGGGALLPLASALHCHLFTSIGSLASTSGSWPHN